MKRIGAGIALMVVVSTLAAPAPAQNRSAWLTPEFPRGREAAGEVLVTVSMWRAGRVEYRTFDGACEVTYSRGGSPPDAVCSEDGAVAPGDYTATSGELFFDEGGTRTITVPLVDDALAEGEESFTLAAWEAVNADPWIHRGTSVVVGIVDSERDDVAGQGSGAHRPPPSSGSPAGGQSSGSEPAGRAPDAGSGAGPTPDPPDAPPATSSARDLLAALPVGELRPGPGFELTAGGPPEPAPARVDASSNRWLAIGFTAAALGVGGLAILQRRRRWSSTRA